MAKNPLITDEVRQVIAEIYLKHSDWRAKEIRDAVEARLHEQNPHSTLGWPGLSAVQKQLTKIRENDEARSPELKSLDSPWSLVSLVQHPIPPEALPRVLEIFMDKLKTGVHLTIREAKWIGRLSFIPLSLENLYMSALEYAWAEKVAEIAGFDVSDPYTLCVDDTLLYEDMRQKMKKPLSPVDIQTLRDGIRTEWLKRKIRKKGG